MSYNYNQAPQYQIPMGHGGYKSFNQYPQWTQTTNTIPQVRPVSSIEEVKASPIDFDGSVFYFTDMANQRIYTKQINLDGTAIINAYVLQNEVDQNVESSFITKVEFEQTIKDLKLDYQNLLNKAMEEIQQAAAQPQKTSFNF